MAYITREDGQQFVIPSYRDVLSSRNKAALKKDILKLSESYGDNITLQPKGINKIEVAFATETGYLLGESVWHHFQRPLDMIYCEAIPDTQEAILVIVKNGSVYLDGSFPVDSIAEELVIFLTQENNFEIYIHGNVPIAQEPEDGKFSFEENSVKSFQVLDDPLFPTLPLLDIYKLQFVDVVLKQHGIGVLPIKQVVMGVLVLGLLYGMWSYLTYTPPPTVADVKRANPYQQFYRELESPAPYDKIKFVTDTIHLVAGMPGWKFNTLELTNNKIKINVTSSGTEIQTLMDWSSQHKGIVSLETNGIFIDFFETFKDRKKPEKIYPLSEITIKTIDNLTQVYHGNFFTIGDISKRNVYQTRDIKIALTGVSPALLAMIGNQLKDLPLVLKELKLTNENGSMSGSIILEALGS